MPEEAACLEFHEALDPLELEATELWMLFAPCNEFVHSRALKEGLL